MSMWTAIAVIVVAACTLQAYRARFSGEAGAGRINDLEARIDKLDADLRGRVETLERIVTDRSANLQREFDRLEKAP